MLWMLYIYVYYTICLDFATAKRVEKSSFSIRSRRWGLIWLFRRCVSDTPKVFDTVAKLFQSIPHLWQPVYIPGTVKGTWADFLWLKGGHLLGFFHWPKFMCYEFSLDKKTIFTIKIIYSCTPPFSINRFSKLKIILFKLRSPLSWT